MEPSPARSQGVEPMSRGPARRVPAVWAVGHGVGGGGAGPGTSARGGGRIRGRVPGPAVVVTLGVQSEGRGAGCIGGRAAGPAVVVTAEGPSGGRGAGGVGGTAVSGFRGGTRRRQEGLVLAPPVLSFGTASPAPPLGTAFGGAATGADTSWGGKRNSSSVRSARPSEVPSTRREG
jgi:hypothetical protein